MTCKHFKGAIAIYLSMLCGTNLNSEFLTRSLTRGQQIVFSWHVYIASVSIILQLAVLYTMIFVK